MVIQPPDIPQRLLQGQVQELRDVSSNLELMVVKSLKCGEALMGHEIKTYVF